MKQEHIEAIQIAFQKANIKYGDYVEARKALSLVYSLIEPLLITPEEYSIKYEKN